MSRRPDCPDLLVTTVEGSIVLHNPGCWANDEPARTTEIYSRDPLEEVMKPGYILQCYNCGFPMVVSEDGLRAATPEDIATFDRVYAGLS